MPIVEVATDGFKMSFRSLEDWIGFVNLTVVPTGKSYGYRVVVEPLPKNDTLVDRA